ncbi:hypothetical protein Bhyg_02265 [Pseudolycoriella hygida]|uniref:Uncharacterized protein n=1 Tax=Pseudolycoriella hygida TaxID=35572 RepID=A0A9Q0S6C8_9DIPT|nr:hypothetical protein Bhyg_02265 [Pseudolycoriella hygida]
MKMMIKAFVAIFIIGLVRQGHAQQCYVCEDCEDANNLREEFLMSCSGDSTTTPTTVPTLSTEPVTVPTAVDPTSIPSSTERPIETPIPDFRENFVKQSNYNCFVIKIEVNGTQKVNRGCVLKSPHYNEMCLRANDNVLPLECRICGTDQCNNASGMMTSVILLFTLVSALLTL